MKNKFKLVLVIISAVFIAIALIVLSLLPIKVDRSSNTLSNTPLPELSSQTQEFHQSLFVGDLHADSLLWKRNLLQKHNYGHVDLPRLIEGNVAIQGFGVVTKVPKNLNLESNKDDSDRITLLAIASGWSPWTWNNLTRRAIYQANKLKKFINKSQGKLTLIQNKINLEKLIAERQQGKQIVGAILGLEGVHAIKGNLKNFDRLYQSGFRLIGMSHFFDNEAVGSAHGTKKEGLTSFGKQLIQHIEAKKAIIDLAHVSPQGIDDILNLTTQPVIVSHTGVKGTCNNQRNLTDDNIKKIAANKGVIGIALFSTAVCGDSLRDTINAVRYVANLVGVDYVALGSDFDGLVTTPIDVAQMSLLTQELFNNGFDKEEVSKIMGGNILRVLFEVFL